MTEFPTPAPTVVIVDGDPRTGEQLRRHLQQEGFDVSLAAGAPALSRILLFHSVDLIVLDRAVPGEDGLSICRRMRASKDCTPIIMMSERADDDDRISGLDAGADDYVGKPFNSRELVARIKAVLRRRPPRLAARAGSDDPGPVHFGPFSVDLAARTLRSDGDEVPLNDSDFVILGVLVRHPRETLSRARLAKLVHGREHGAFDRGLDVQISRLRKALQVDAESPGYIQTVWGVGYVFVPEGQGSELVRRRGRRQVLDLRAKSAVGRAGGADDRRCHGHSP